MQQETVIQLARGKSGSTQQQGHSQPHLQDRTLEDKYLTFWERALTPAQLHSDVPLRTPWWTHKKRCSAHTLLVKPFGCSLTTGTWERLEERSSNLSELDFFLIVSQWGMTGEELSYRVMNCAEMIAQKSHK